MKVGDGRLEESCVCVNYCSLKLLRHGTETGVCTHTVGRQLSELLITCFGSRLREMELHPSFDGVLQYGSSTEVLRTTALLCQGELAGASSSSYCTVRIALHVATMSRLGKATSCVFYGANDTLLRLSQSSASSPGPLEQLLPRRVRRDAAEQMHRGCSSTFLSAHYIRYRTYVYVLYLRSSTCP